MDIQAPLHPVFARAQALLSTQGRQRMAVVVCSTLFFSFFSVGLDIVLPLWVTGALGLTAADWASLRMLRMVGILVGVILLGPLSDRFGQRVIGAVSMVGVATILVGLCYGTNRTLWLTMPVLGALISTAFVNLNTLTQGVSAARQGLANTIYRSVGVATSIGAPVAATGLATVWGGYRPVFLSFAAALLVAAVILWFYPNETTPPPLGGLGAELRRLWRAYLPAFRERPLIAFLLVSQLWGNLLAGVGLFVAIRFVRELLPAHVRHPHPIDLAAGQAWLRLLPHDPARQGDLWFGALGTVGGIVTLLGVLLLGLRLDRLSLRRTHMVLGLLASLCAAGMGLTDSVLLTAAAAVLFIAFTTMLIAPTSMWTSRAAGAASQTAAFTVQKVSTAGMLAVTTALLGWLEPHVGIRALMLYGGLASLTLSFAYLMLAEPPKLGTIPERENT
jgi:MFS family permease